MLKNLMLYFPMGAGDCLQCTLAAFGGSTFLLFGVWGIYMFITESTTTTTKGLLSSDGPSTV